MQRTPSDPTPERSVGELVAAAAGGDSGAWSELVARHAGLVWAVARSFRLGHADAADVSQSVWLRLVENLDAVRDPSRIAGWLATTTRRECLRTLRASGREVADDDTVSTAAAGAEARVDETPEAALLADESQRDLWRAVATLPERCQRLLRLFAYQPDLSYAEMSTTLDVPIGSIGPTRGRCLTALRAALAIHAGPPSPGSPT